MTGPKKIIVEAVVIKMVPEKQRFTFMSLADPPVNCCKCFPGAITEAGFCCCCGFDHATGEGGDRSNDPTVN